MIDNRNQPAVALIRREIARLETKLEKLLLEINHDCAGEYKALTDSVMGKGLAHKAGELSTADYAAFLESATKKEAAILARLNPKVTSANWEKRIKLERTIANLQWSLYSFGG